MWNDRGYSQRGNQNIQGGNFSSRNQSRPEVSSMPPTEVNKIAEEAISCKNPKDFIEYADKVARLFKKEDVSTSTLRNIYSQVLGVQTHNEEKILLLKPKIAYLRGRDLISSDVKNIFDKIIDNLVENKDDTKKSTENFKKFFEAVVAYQKCNSKEVDRNE